ncbi:MAG: Holliday junction branch migration protein RuvA [Spirochaetota bacterium]
MFNSLSGTITGRGPNALFLTTAGVEWELEVSGFTLRTLASNDADDRVRVYTYLYHREDQMRLFGFASPDERRVFLELTRVSGIGPRAAVKMLSATSPSELIRMLEAEDVDGLVRLPGLGRKTAQKMILALRGKLVAESAEGTSGHVELVEALVEMGFDRSRTISVVNALASELADSAGADPTAAEKEIFRQAIVRLSGE